jgi:YfiR/HmsC-like
MAVLRRVATLTILAGWLTLGAASAGAGEDELSEYEIKAAFLLNFARFVEWPPAEFASPNDPIVLGVFGTDPFGAALDQITAGKKINGRPLAIRRITDLSGLRACQLVFVPASDARRLEDVVAAVGNRGVLIVGESKGFTGRGGMINFVLRDNHVRFEVNPAAAARAGIKVSSKMLQLAIIVSGSSQGK